MAGRVEEQGRRDDVAEAIEQTFLKVEAGSAAAQKRDSLDSGKALARTSPRRRGGTTRLNLADVLGSTDAAGPSRSRIPAVEPENQRPQPSAETPARRTPRDRRKGGTTRLDLDDVFGAREAALQLRRRSSSVQADNQRPQSTSQRLQRLAAEPSPAIRTNLGHGISRTIGNPDASGQPTGPEFRAVASSAADSSRVPLPAALPETQAASVDGQVTLSRLDVPDQAKLAGVGAQHPEVNIFDSGAEIIILADLPGLDLKTLAVTSDGHGLTIAGNRKPQPRMEGALCRWRERNGVAFVRTLQLPESLEFTRASATYRNGILQIRAPKGQALFKITVQ
jgi:HSP20 family protein